MKKIILILTCLLFIPAIVFFAMNSRDEPLDPKAKALLNLQIQDVDDNAYPFLLGFACAPEQNPQTWGKERIRLSEVGEESTLTGNFTVEDSNNELCNFTEANCLKKYLDAPQTIQRVLKDNQLWLLRYRQLIAHKHYAYISSFSFNSPLPSFRVIRDAQKLLQADIVLDPLLVTDGLDEDIEFWRMILSQPTDLITKIVAVATLRSSYSFLNQLLEQYPELRPRFKQQLRSLNNDEKSLAHSMDLEFIIMAKIILNLQYEKDIENVCNIENVLQPPFFFDSKWLRRMSFSFYKKNATINQCYHYIDKQQNATLQGSAAMETVYQEEVEKSTKIFFYAYNPIGKILLSIGIAPMHSYQKRIEDLDSLITELMN